MEEKTTSVAQEFALLRSCLATIPDPRYPRGRVHPLEGVLSLSVLALMADCRSLSSIHRFGELHPQVLELLDLRRSSSVATLARLLRMVSVAQVAEALRRFAEELLEGRYLGEPLAVAADGKTLRGVWEEGQQLGVLHLFVHQAQLALDQVRTLYQVEEARAAKTWLEELAGQFPGLAVLTGDGLLADRDLCAAIVAQDQDYLVKLKKPNSTFLKR